MLHHRCHRLLLTQGLLLPSCLHTCLDPLLCQIVIPPLHLDQVVLHFLLIPLKADFVCLCFRLSEEPDRVSQRIPSVLSSILCVAHVLHALPKRGEILQMFLLRKSAFLRGFILTQLLDSLFVVGVLGHVADVRFDVVASLERLPRLRVVEILRQLVKPLLIFSFALLGRSHWPFGSLGTLLL